MKTSTPYLFFAGNCKDALVFYKESIAADARIMIMTYGETPEPIPMTNIDNIKTKYCIQSLKRMKYSLWRAMI